MSEPRDDFEQRFAQRYADYLEDGVTRVDARTVTARVTADAPRRAGRLQMAILGTASVLAAAVITLLALGVLPKLAGPTGTASESAQASGAPSVTVAPAATVSPSPTLVPTPAMTPSQPVAVAWPTAAPSEASVPSSLDGQDFAFWTVHPAIPCCGATLRISTSSGDRRDIVDSADAILSSWYLLTFAGPADGRVLYVVDDGNGASLMVGNATTGTVTELTRTDQVVARLAIDPSGSTAYYLLYDRQTEAFGGLWATSTNGGQPRPLIAAQATTAMATLAAERTYTPELVVSQDGNWIVSGNCAGKSCAFYASHPDATGEPLDPSILHAGDHPIGITGDLLIGSTECPQENCDGFVLDLRTSERWPLGGTGQPFAPTQLIVGPHGPLVIGVGVDYNHGGWTVEALDLTDGSRSSVFGTTFQPGTTMVGLASDDHMTGYLAAAELPAGWFLIYRTSAVDPLAAPPDYSAVAVGTGTEVRLPFIRTASP